MTSPAAAAASQINRDRVRLGSRAGVLQLRTCVRVSTMSIFFDIELSSATNDCCSSASWSITACSALSPAPPLIPAPPAPSDAIPRRPWSAGSAVRARFVIKKRIFSIENKYCLHFPRFSFSDSGFFLVISSQTKSQWSASRYIVCISSYPEQVEFSFVCMCQHFSNLLEQT